MGQQSLGMHGTGLVGVCGCLVIYIHKHGQENVEAPL